ncbi:NUDIX domain-containing protein [Candidatus Daviesbacteria bacterium]|nr:NUDIX domain-containing protein [Candidatus Daviesbacteria bacterium]
MIDQIILGADENGKFSGEYFPKSVGHTGLGKRHFAITVLVYNSQGEILLQRRKHQIFDNIWDITGSTHQLHKKDGKDETDEEATLRCLGKEYGIKKVENLKNYGGVNYFAEYGDFCENEHDIIFTARYDGEVRLNLQVAYEYRWEDKNNFLKDIEKNPQNYTPWAIKAITLLKEKKFF